MGNVKSAKGASKNRGGSRKVAARVKSDKESKVRTVWAGIGLILLPLVVGFSASALTVSIMESFGELNQPPFAPPALLFPVAWTTLYLLMGVASFLIWRLRPKTKEGRRLRRAELAVYFVQLFFNFWWTLIFFRFGLRYFAFGWLIVMWAMILWLIIAAFRNCKVAAWCLIPYILWCTFAAVLNISVAMLN